MKYLRIPLVVLIALTMTSWARILTPVSHASTFAAQTGQATALERGYRTGYSDGFSAGSRDIAEHAARDFRGNEDYQRGDRSFNETWGTIEDYRDGYQQGFETGYNAGYDHRPFESSIPTGLSRRGTTDSAPGNPPDNDPGTSGETTGVQTSGQTNSQTSGAMNGPVFIPRDSILLVELESALSTDASQRGDRFQARVIEPREFAGAIVDGRVTRVKRAGKVKGTSEMQLSFESINLPDGRTAQLNADVVELIDMGNRDEAGTVDPEGGVKGRSSTKDDISRVGATTGIGAIIGAVVGGGKGAAIGAAIGAGVGTGSVFTKRGQDVRLDRGQQMKIRTANETRVE
ncbi:MAG: hypothetical protein ACRD9S_08890 [Pyrinomonadaceae bacterium]